MIPNQYDDDFFKSQLEGLINRKMVDIVRVATKERARCEEYTAIDMSVNSLAVWHSSLSLHARRVLGVTHGKDEGCKETQIAAKTGATIVSWRSLCQAWGESEAQQPRRVRQSSSTRRSLCQAWGESSETQTESIDQLPPDRRHSPEH
jgi:hypothetical protein